MELFSKLLSQTDVNHRLAVPTEYLWAFGIPNGEHKVDVPTTDGNEQEWRFVLSTRTNEPNPKPVFVGEWLQFVRSKGLRVGDKVIFDMEEDQGYGVQFRIHAHRKIVIHGTEIWADVN